MIRNTLKYLHLFTFLMGIGILFNACKEDADPVIYASAGSPKLNIGAEGYKVAMNASALSEGQTGTWKIFRGEHGMFEDVHNPQTIFHGEPGELYSLIWEVIEGDVIKAPMIDVSFVPLQPVILEGVQDTVTDTYTLQLEADTSKYGEKGYWEYEGPEGAYFTNPDSCVSGFVGFPDQDYKVIWTLEHSNTTDTTSFEVYFDSLRAITGGDMMNEKANGDRLFTNLNATLQEGATGNWTIIEGENGHVYTPSNGNSLFEGDFSELYKLVWEVNYAGFTEYDTISLLFAGTHETWTDPRDDQEYRTIKINGLEWMADNYNYAYDPGNQSWYYGLDYSSTVADGEKVTSEEAQKRYGRLYTYWAAIYGAPEGWRLPTEEEWNEMMVLFGGNTFAGEAVKEGGVSGLEVPLGGVYETRYQRVFPEFSGQDVNAFYWTFNEGDANSQLTTSIVFNTSDIVNYAFSGPYYAFSVRYVREY